MGLGAEFFLEVGSTDLDALKVAVELVAAVAAAPSFWKNLQIWLRMGYIFGYEAMATILA